MGDVAAATAAAATFAAASISAWRRSCAEGFTTPFASEKSARAASVSASCREVATRRNSSAASNRAAASCAFLAFISSTFFFRIAFFLRAASPTASARFAECAARLAAFLAAVAHAEATLAAGPAA